MITRFFDWLGYLAVSRPRGVLALYAIVLLAVTGLGCASTFAVFVKCRPHLAYWL